MKHNTSIRRKRLYITILKYCVLILISLLLLFPFYWMVITSLKSSTQIFVFPPELFPRHITFENFTELFNHMKFFRYLWNSLLVSCVNSFFIVLISGITAYAFAKIRFAGRNIIFIFFLAGLMVPVEVITVPLYFMLGKIGWVDKLRSLMVPTIFGSGGVFGLFILRQFFITIPDDLCEAARIDGCSHLGIVFRIVMPMAKSAIATVVIFTFANCWNEFFQPLIFLSSQSNYTLPLGLAMFSDEGGTKWHLVMAASTLATIPLLTVFYMCQDKFIDSMAMSGIK
ncbi:MAG: carbohydrate ABC transporter permease [Oscillospiraceae bacterium]|nr:carbohydrate ABC transporter permease [Oscillospiraceae bacterium]